MLATKRAAAGMMPSAAHVCCAKGQIPGGGGRPWVYVLGFPRTGSQSLLVT